MTCRGTTAFLAVVAAVAVQLGLPAQAATIGQSIPAHSHWDVRHHDHQLQICYTLQATPPTTGVGSTIAWIPHREKDSQNFMQLDITRTGFKLEKRTAGVFTTIVPDAAVPNPHLTFGTAGQEIMFQYEMRGADFFLYELLPGNVRGTLWYHWTDSSYPDGMNFSYYTAPQYFGEWDFIHGRPLDNVGMPHDASSLMQDARKHPAVATTQNTYDDPTPASGGVSGISAVLGGSPTFGLASGTNYTYSIDVTGAGSGTFDFRDPVPENLFFNAGWYRLTIGNPATLRRYNGSTAGAKWSATAGGPGAYTLTLTGGDMTLAKAGVKVLQVNDGGPTSGVRVRVRPSTSTWAWTGTVN